MIKEKRWHMRKGNYFVLMCIQFNVRGVIFTQKQELGQHLSKFRKRRHTNSLIPNLSVTLHG